MFFQHPLSNTPVLWRGQSLSEAGVECLDFWMLRVSYWAEGPWALRRLRTPYLRRRPPHPPRVSRCGPSSPGGGRGPAAAPHPGRPVHSATRAPHPPQRRRPRGRPARPRSPAPGRPQQRPAGPSRRRTRCPSARHATPPGGPHTHGAHQPDAAALQGRRRGCDILETPGLAGRQGLGAVLQGRDREPLRKQEAG